MFSYELAGLGSRFLAVLIDLLIQIAILLAIVFGLIGVASLHPSVTHASSIDKAAQSLVVAFIVIVLFLIFFAYFIAFEALWNGQTPGKRLLGIRVVRDGGHALDATASLIRNLIRIIEFGLGFYAISALSTLLSLENKRLGDFAAGTIVIRETRAPVSLARFLADERPDSGPITAALSQAERDLLRRFIAARGKLSNAARAKLANTIAQQFRPKVPPELAALNDEALLERLSVS